MRTHTIRIWSAVHTWTGLACTGFLLLLCLSGLPLIFRDEINGLLGNNIEVPAMPPGTPRADLDRVAAAAMMRRLGEVPQYLFFDDDDPNQIYVTLAPTPASPPSAAHPVVVDSRTALVLREPNTKTGFIMFIYHLHTDLFAGLPGKLFLGLMGLLFIAAIVSGLVLYAPFMRRLRFGTVRRDRSRRIRWLDLHNLLGVVTVAWALVVGATGVINTWADVIKLFWQRNQLVEMVASHRGLPPMHHPASVAVAVASARAAAPGMEPSLIAYPGTALSSPQHYAVFLRGATPLTSRLLKPALVDAETGQLTDIRDLPWYGKALLVSQPLHFGDYGGLPLRLIWAGFDLVTIIVLGSGLYLWIGQRRTPMGDQLRSR